MSTPHAPDLEIYPVVTIGDKQYTVRLDIFDIIALEKQGVDILRATDYDMPGPDGNCPSIVERSFKILAQGIHAGIGWEDLVRQLGLNGINKVIPQVSEAIKKVRAQIAGPTEAAPTATVTPSIQ